MSIWAIVVVLACETYLFVAFRVGGINGQRTFFSAIQNNLETTILISTRARSADFKQAGCHDRSAKICNRRIGARMQLESVPRPPSSEIVVLDFDDIVYNSEPIRSRVAWQTACILWPERMAAVSDVPLQQVGARRAWVNGDWRKLVGEGADGFPKWLRAKMRQIQPVVETEVDNVLLLRLLVEEALSDQSRPLTVGEIASNWDPYFRDMLLGRYDTREESIIKLFSREHGEYRRWLERQTTDSWGEAFFHGDMRDSICKAIQLGREVYILTGEQPQFVRSLLDETKCTLEDDYIIQLGSRNKVEILCELQQIHPLSQLVFVGGRVEDIRAVCNNVNLFSVKLYFSEWCHSGPQQHAVVASWPRVRSLSRAEDLVNVIR